MNYHDSRLIHEYIFDVNSPYFANYGVVIKGGKSLKGVRSNIMGIPTNTIQIGTSAQYSQSSAGSFAETIQKDFKDALTNFATKGIKSSRVQGKANDVMGSTIGRFAESMGIAPYSVPSTVPAYTMTGVIPVTLEITVMAQFAVNPSVGDMLDTSLAMTQPLEIMADNLIKVPFGWNPGFGQKSDVTIDNTFSVCIGRHLCITHLIPKSFDYQYSSQVYEDTGEPVYCTFRYSFETARVMDKDEVRKWWLTS